MCHPSLQDQDYIKRVTPKNRLPLKTITTTEEDSNKPVLSSSHITMQPPCMAQVAGHTSGKTWPAQMHEASDTILAAILICLFGFESKIQCIVDKCLN